MSKSCTLCKKELTSGQIICLECANKVKNIPSFEEFDSFLFDLLVKYSRELGDEIMQILGKNKEDGCLMSFHLIIISKLMGMGLDIKKKIYGKAFGDNEG